MFDPGEHDWFHASPTPGIARFAPFSHFGTREAALARAARWADEGPVVLYRVAIDVEPAACRRTPDLSAGPRSAVHSPLRLADHLHYTVRPPLLAADERDRVIRASASGTEASLAALADLLEEKGVAALVYRNDFESPGSDSIILVSGASARLIEESELDYVALQAASSSTKT